MSNSLAATQLPEPDELGRVHSDALRQLIVDRIQASQAPVSFAEYMSQVLYEPGMGYYMAGSAKFGASGDFITAPEVSPLFGAALGNQVAAIFDQVGGGAVLELGAGSGKLAAGLLQSLGDGYDFSYIILEPSAELVQRQQDLLRQVLTAELFNRVSWVQSLPEGFTGVIIANEVMDALPVERFCIADDGVDVEQLCVSPELADYRIPAPERLKEAVGRIQQELDSPLPSGYCSEVSLLLGPWLATLEACLDKGVILLVDYGYPRREYYLDERSRGTLACYYRHRAHDDPYRWPGLQDITAHVDFTLVAESAVELKMDLLGYASQSAFLLDSNLLGLADLQRQLLNSETDHIALSRAVKTLTLPGEMGERFQVMALGKRYDLPLLGFRTQDLSYRL